MTKFSTEHFPEIESGLKVLGGGVLIQGKLIPSKTRGGIIITDTQRKYESYDVMVGKVVALGPLAYRNKETLEQWVEGNWCNVGDLVSIPRTGTRYTKTLENGDEVHFVLVQDIEVKTVYTDTTGYSFGD